MFNVLSVVVLPLVALLLPVLCGNAHGDVTGLQKFSLSEPWHQSKVDFFRIGDYTLYFMEPMQYEGQKGTIEMYDSLLCVENQNSLQRNVCPGTLSLVTAVYTTPWPEILLFQMEGGGWPHPGVCRYGHLLPGGEHPGDDRRRGNWR